MKNIIILLLLTSICKTALPQGGTWTWVKGSSLAGDLGNTGSMGVTNSANYPDGRYQAGNWIDQNGNFWIFGGVDNNSSERNDLWKYDPVANTWTWVKGPLTGGGAGVYGTMGVPGPNNVPGARGWGMVTWTDQQNHLWLRSGYGYDQLGIYGTIDDMWMYDISTNQWTWMQGAGTGGGFPVYGTLSCPEIGLRQT